MTASDPRTLSLRAAAMLLDYPDAELVARAPLLDAVAERLPQVSAARLHRVVARLTSSGLEELQREYVSTFDLQRRHCLYLTYYAYGDTRKRGMALLRFTHAYRQAGIEFVGNELVDHLAVVCEFAASHPEPGLRLLRENRVSIDLLCEALGPIDSPWLDVVELVRDVLPPASARDIERAISLARGGPPAEEVGLEPFAPTDYMPDYVGARR